MGFNSGFKGLIYLSICPYIDMTIYSAGRQSSLLAVCPSVLESALRAAVPGTVHKMVDTNSHQ